jgi:hypothetical protein
MLRLWVVGNGMEALDLSIAEEMWKSRNCRREDDDEKNDAMKTTGAARQQQ